MTLPNQVHQYPHESWSEAWHRRQAENLARIEAAIKNLDQLHKRDRELGQQMVQAVTDFSQGFNKAVEKL
jgi:hypothetical protein